VLKYINSYAFFFNVPRVSETSHYIVMYGFEEVN
jgi:hypothetical protein